MSYEEKYKEALKRADSLTEKYGGRDFAEYVFPELAESEDERIRTELLSSFKGIMADADEDELWYGLPYNDIIAWLEKQKEQKQEWKPEPESLEALMYAIEGKWDRISPTSYLSRRLEDLYEGLVNTFNVDESLIAELPKVASRDYTAEEIEELRELKRKIETSMEQKPTECADDVVEEAEEYTSKVDCGEYGAEVTEAYIAGVLAERNRKPAEWSEELKNELAKKHLEGYIMGREDTMREMKDFLESHFNTQSGTSTSKAEEEK